MSGKDQTNPFLRSPNEVEAPDESGPVAPDEARLAEEERRRREAEADMEVAIIENVREGSETPVQPTRLKGSHRFQFRCHKGVSCWNECCYDTNITLTPFDILRLSRRFDIRPAAFLATYTYPSMFDRADLPVAKLSMIDSEGGKNPCVFLDPEAGCTVYEDRPAACRYYPLGLASVKMKGHESPEDFYFLVKEPHCKGHLEDKEQTVDEFRREQGVDIYDRLNRGWIDLLMKMASWKVLGGPWGRELDKRTKKMFFMATTDPDAFRRFVFETKFLDAYDIDPEFVERIKTDDEMLLKMAFDWLKHIIFNEETFALKEPVLQKAIAKAREEAGGV